MKLVNQELTSLEWQVYRYLKENCMGEKNAIGMKYLAETFWLGERDLRQMIKNITESKVIHTIIASSSKGYYIPLNEQESIKANAMLKSRLEGALRRYYGNNPNDRHWIYNLLKELDEQYEAPPQNQTVIKFNGQEKDINYFGDREQKSYNSLFEFATQNEGE